MRRFALVATTAIAWAMMPISATTAQEAPPFMKEVFPEQGLAAAWQEYQAIMMSPDAALDAKTRELIGLAVAAQIPCEYCIYFHTKAAEANGASAAEIKEALAVSALTRKWSTMLNGSQYDFDTFRKQVDAAMGGH